MTIKDIEKQFEKVLNGIYIHGTRKSTEVNNLPEDEYTIEEGIQLLKSSIQQALEEVKPKKKKRCLKVLDLPVLKRSGKFDSDVVSYNQCLKDLEDNIKRFINEEKN